MIPFGFKISILCPEGQIVSYEYCFYLKNHCVIDKDQLASNEIYLDEVYTTKIIGVLIGIQSGSGTQCRYVSQYATMPLFSPLNTTIIICSNNNSNHICPFKCSVKKHQIDHNITGTFIQNKKAKQAEHQEPLAKKKFKKNGISCIYYFQSRASTHEKISIKKIRWMIINSINSFGLWYFCLFVSQLKREVKFSINVLQCFKPMLVNRSMKVSFAEVFKFNGTY